jgi:hypothetical protein
MTFPLIQTSPAHSLSFLEPETHTRIISTGRTAMKTKLLPLLLSGATASQADVEWAQYFGKDTRYHGYLRAMAGGTGREIIVFRYIADSGRIDYFLCHSQIIVDLSPIDIMDGMDRS